GLVVAIFGTTDKQAAWRKNEKSSRPYSAWKLGAGRRDKISTFTASDLHCGFIWIDQPGADRDQFAGLFLKTILSDWRKSKKFVEQCAELYRLWYRQRNPMSSGRKLGDEAASRLASRATLALTARPINPTKMKTPLNHLDTARFSPAIFRAALVCTLVFSTNVLRADETC